MTALSADGGGGAPGNRSTPVAALAALAGGAGSRPQTLAALVAAVRAAGPEAPHSGGTLPPSDLTPSGAAFEAAVVWPSGDLRVSLDPCPGAPAAARRAACLSALDAMARRASLCRQQQTILARVRDWQDAHPARYGAWLGLRPLGGGDAASVRAKLYLDVPVDAPWQAFEEDLVGAPPVLPNRDIRLTMIGLDPLKGGAELYWRCGRLYPGEIDTLLRRFRLPERGREIVAWIEALTQRSVRFELPAYDMGFSCAVDAGFVPRVFTWYANATSFLGPPERCRAALLRVGEAAGWPMDDYLRLTRPDARGRVPMHGLIGAILADGAPLAATATVAVDAACDGEGRHG